MRMLKIPILSSFQISHSNLSSAVMHLAVTADTQNLFFCNWKFVLADLHLSISPPSHPLVTTILFSVSIKLAFFWFKIPHVGWYPTFLHYFLNSFKDINHRTASEPWSWEANQVSKHWDNIESIAVTLSARILHTMEAVASYRSTKRQRKNDCNI